MTSPSHLRSNGHVHYKLVIAGLICVLSVDSLALREQKLLENWGRTEFGVEEHTAKNSQRCCIEAR